MEYKTLEVEQKGGIATIRLNRPERRNAFDDQVSGELDDIFGICEDDPEVKVIILTGSGKAFCAGGDVKEMANAEDPKEFLENLAAGIHRPIMRIWNMEKVVIAAINGAAVGAGCGLAMACDIRVASEDAEFNMGFMKIGLAPGCGTYFLPRLVGRAKASELIFLSETLDAVQAEKLGLVNKVVKHDDLMPEILKMAGRIEKGPTLAIGRAKTLLRLSERESLIDHFDAERHMISMSGETADYREGITAFLEKRKPKFEGK